MIGRTTKTVLLLAITLLSIVNIEADIVEASSNSTVCYGQACSFEFNIEVSFNAPVDMLTVSNPYTGVQTNITFWNISSNYLVKSGQTWQAWDPIVTQETDCCCPWGCSISSGTCNGVSTSIWYQFSLADDANGNDCDMYGSATCCFGMNIQNNIGYQVYTGFTSQLVSVSLVYQGQVYYIGVSNWTQVGPMNITVNSVLDSVPPLASYVEIVFPNGSDILTTSGYVNNPGQNNFWEVGWWRGSTATIQNLVSTNMYPTVNSVSNNNYSPNFDYATVNDIDPIEVPDLVPVFLNGKIGSIVNYTQLQDYLGNNFTYGAGYPTGVYQVAVSGTVMDLCIVYPVICGCNSTDNFTIQHCSGIGGYISSKNGSFYIDGNGNMFQNAPSSLNYFTYYQTPETVTFQILSGALVPEILVGDITPKVVNSSTNGTTLFFYAESLDESGFCFLDLSTGSADLIEISTNVTLFMYNTTAISGEISCQEATAFIFAENPQNQSNYGTPQNFSYGNFSYSTQGGGSFLQNTTIVWPWSNTSTDPNNSNYDPNGISWWYVLLCVFGANMVCFCIALCMEFIVGGQRGEVPVCAMLCAYAVFGCIILPFRVLYLVVVYLRAQRMIKAMEKSSTTDDESPSRDMKKSLTETNPSIELTKRDRKHSQDKMEVKSGTNPMGKKTIKVKSSRKTSGEHSD